MLEEATSDMRACTPLPKKMSQPWDVVVVGSCMIDLVCYTSKLPKGGETVRGSTFSSGFGGKGCNQCIAARKLGANCILVARVGDDHFGREYYNKILEYQIPGDYVKVTDGVSSGMAQIVVSDNGENQIVIVPGANNYLSVEDIAEACPAIVDCSVLVCQMEVPQDATMEALKIKSAAKIGKSILNAAPASADLHPLLFSLPDVFCVNESEAEIITGRPVTNLKEAYDALKRLLRKGCNEVVITLGSQGCVYGKQDVRETLHIPACQAVAVDTTGAGDSFVGALAFLMATNPGLPMGIMLKKASMAAAFSVQHQGSQSSFPTVDDLPEEFAIF